VFTYYLKAFIFIILNSKASCFSSRRLWSVAFVVSQSSHRDEIAIYSYKAELVYIGKRRTISFNKYDTRINKSGKYNHLTEEETQYQKGITFWPTLYKFYQVVHKK